MIFISFITILIIDQAIKYIFLTGFRFDSKCISLTLAINKGVAFSMFSFLGEYLKYIQLLFLGFIIYFLKREKILVDYPIISGMLLAAAFSNLLDRFLRGGVVDYVYYHCYFNFAIFNFADVVIDFSLLMLFYFTFFKDKIKKNIL